MKKKYISEEAWRKIFSFLKECKEVHAGLEYDCGKFIEAIFWMVRTGAQWCELPEKYGKRTGQSQKKKKPAVRQGLCGL